VAYLLERLPSGSRIAVIRLRSLGDCVLTTPALALLKAHRPDLKIGVVVEDRWRAVFEEDEIIPSQALRTWHPRAVLNLHGGTTSMWLTAALGAKIRAGFAHHKYSFVYTHKIPRAQEILGEERRVHTAEHLASAMFWMGVPRTEIPRAQLSAGPTPIEGAYAVVHPFATTPQKTWPAERYLAVAETLRNPVFLAGPDDDASKFAKYRVIRNAPLAEVKSIIAGAQLFIGNDSGPAHIAAAFGVPVVVLFGPSDPVNWAPWRTESQVLTSPGAIGAISVDQVIAAAEALRVRA
jgi:heptosyltransferase-3